VDVPIVATVGAFVVFCVGRVIYTDFLSPEARVKRALAGRRRVPIGEAQEGPVRLTGRARQVGELLRAPASQRPCVAFQLVVEERGGSNGWQKVLELAVGAPFRLEDESGAALVDTAAGPFSLALVPDRTGSPSVFGSENDNVKRVRALAGLERVRAFRFSEAALAVGRPVSVGGRCAREVALDGDRANYREPPQRLVVRGTAEEPLLISNWREARQGPGME
jgi:hypothetical protein